MLGSTAVRQAVGSSKLMGDVLMEEEEQDALHRWDGYPMGLSGRITTLGLLDFTTDCELC